MRGVNQMWVVQGINSLDEVMMMEGRSGRHVGGYSCGSVGSVWRTGRE